MSGRKRTIVPVDEIELRRLREMAAQVTNLQASNRILNQLNAKNDAVLSDYQARIQALNQNIGNMNARIANQGAAASKEAQELRERLQQTVKESNDRIQAESRKNEQQIIQMRENFSEEIRRASKESDARIQEQSRKNEQQVREVHQNITRELSSVRREFSAALDQTRTDMADALNANNRRIENAMRQNNQLLKDEMDSLETRMKDEMQAIHSQLDTIESSVSSTAHNQSVLLEMACEYERAADMICEDIQQNYRVDLLCPGRLEPVLQSFQSCQSHIKDAEQMPENSATARLVARQALEAAFQLRQDVISAEQEWNLHLEAARRMLGVASAQLEAGREIPLADEEDHIVDVDTWTAGDLTAIEGRLHGLNEQLDNSGELTVSDLDGIQSAGLQISREIDDAAMFAVEAIVSSQDRWDIADEIHERLREMGLTLLDGGYQGNDQRAAHRIHLRNNVTGFEIVITQIPITQQDGTIVNRLESDIIHFGTENPAAGGQLARDVLEAMSGGKVDTVQGFQNSPSDRTNCVDIQQWRTQTSTDFVKPNHNLRGTCSAN